MHKPKLAIKYHHMSTHFRGGSDLLVKTPPPNCIAMYKHTLTSGLRFPLHPLIVEIFHDYKIDLPQLTPNSWPSIFSFIATCTLKHLSCTLTAFKMLYFLQHNSNKNKSKGRWCLYNRNGFLTAIDRPTSIHNDTQLEIWVHFCGEGPILKAVAGDELEWRVNDEQQVFRRDGRWEEGVEIFHLYTCWEPPQPHEAVENSATVAFPWKILHQWSFLVYHQA